jgi:hypothetical protein|tara:strand:- start:48 stop:1343 length:1296 start_codon:yes stop_codon:yes gene_type:complete
MGFNINKIVKEWSYRVHDGMPDIKNSLHMVQLRELLREYKITEHVIDMLINNLSGEKKKNILKKEILKEARSIASAGDIEWCISALQSGEVIDKEIIAKIKALCKTDVDIFEGIKKEMVKKSIPENRAYEIAKSAHKLCDDPKVFLKYVKSPTLDIKSISGISDIISGLPSGIGGDFAKWIVNFQFTHGRINMGRGEVALSILLKGGGIPKKGDLFIKGIGEVEIKENGGRIMGQAKGKGVVAGAVGATAIRKAFNDGLIKRLKDNKVVPEDVPEVYKGNNSWNHTSGNWGIETLTMEILKVAKKYKIEKVVFPKGVANEEAEIWKQSYYALYPGINKKYVNFTKDLIGNTGKISDKTKWKDNLFYALLRHYQDADKWDAIIVGDKGLNKIVLATPADLNSLSSVMSKFKYQSPPSYGSTNSSATFTIWPA